MKQRRLRRLGGGEMGVIAWGEREVQAVRTEWAGMKDHGHLRKWWKVQYAHFLYLFIDSLLGTYYVPVTARL